MTLSERDFIELVTKVVGYLPQDPKGNPELHWSWTTGGITGGSWGGVQPDTPVEPSPEPDMDSLEQVLEIVSPNITFLQFRKMTREIMLVEDRTNASDYYGNVYHERTKRILLKNLYRYLNREQLLDTEAIERWTQDQATKEQKKSRGEKKRK